MSRLGSLALVIAVWAALYLPWLGTSGLRSEEGHRVLPAVEMIESGNYLVPQIAGEPYLRKPPLINWLIAGSFELFGQRNEWTARAPSVISVLLVAIAFVTTPPSLLGGRGALAAALAWLTSLGMLEKGRMIEIEALYVSLFAFALICWLASWRTGRSPWLTWTLPWLFLGLGLLAKGPALLFFFYFLVMAILSRTNRLRAALHPAHFVGLVLMGMIFSAWAVPYARAVAAEPVAGTWTTEMVNRFISSEGTVNDWLLNWPLALAYFLPAGLLLPFVRFDKMPPEDATVARGLFWGSAIPFILVLLLPGAIQRYVLPTVVSACLLVGFAVKNQAFDWLVPRRFVLAAVLTIALGAAIVFPLRSATVQKQRPAYDAVASTLNAAIPPGATLYAVRLRYQPYLFYIDAPLRYVRTLEELPKDARFFIVPEKLQETVERTRPDARLVLRTKSFRGAETLLYEVNR